MRESRSYGSVGERGGNEPLYPEKLAIDFAFPTTISCDHRFVSRFSNASDLLICFSLNSRFSREKFPLLHFAKPAWLLVPGRFINPYKNEKITTQALRTSRNILIICPLREV